MANEDVPTTKCDGCGQPISPIFYFHHLAECIVDLAAALREAREDTKRLDFALAMGPLLLVENDGNGMLVRTWDVEDRAEIDAAMKPPGGEGGVMERGEPKIHSHITDELEEGHPLEFSQVSCVNCGEPVHAANNECMQTWIETGVGMYCVTCFFDDDRTVLDDRVGLLREEPGGEDGA